MHPYSEKKTVYCPDTQERVKGSNYLQSKHWKNLRVKVYEYYKGQCQRCKDYIPLSVAHVHHRTYKRMGNEKVSDLILYCEHCHTCVHKERKDTRKEKHTADIALQKAIKQMTPEEKKKLCYTIAQDFDSVDMDREVIGKKVNKKKLTKSACRYYDFGNCRHFGYRCFDCKEYNHNPNYRS